MSNGRKPASPLTARRNRDAAASLPLADEEDFAEARRGLIAPFEPATVVDEGGRVAWDIESYDFIAGEAPDTVNPSLWRQSKLNCIAGLFELAPGFYQLRGFLFDEPDPGFAIVTPD